VRKNDMQKWREGERRRQKGMGQEKLKVEKVWRQKIKKRDEGNEK
jgi:hypothetical protein